MSEIDWDNLPPTTVPATTQVAARGFASDEVATQLGRAVAQAVHTIGSIIDLSTIDGVTVAADYDAALQDLDRGIEGLRPLVRSNNEEMQGVAMSPAVMRDGKVRTHLIFNADWLVPLIADEEEFTPSDRATAIGIIAHECAHVQVTAEKERAIPEARLGTRIDGYERAVMFQLAEICWDEYAACRLSALFALEQIVTHSQTLIACAEVARDRSDEAIREYRVHHDLNRLVSEASSALLQPMKAAAYLLGTMDGRGVDWAALPEVRGALEGGDYDDLVDKLHAELCRLWDTRESWQPTLSVFQNLESLAKEVFNSGGIFFSTSADGQGRVDVPFTPWTMP